MTIIVEERLSDSPYVEKVMHGWTASDGSAIRPAESHWHMVFVRVHGRALPLVVGPLTTAGVASWKEGAEILWIKFNLGVFMPHFPARNFLDVQRPISEAAGRSFWLNGSVWQVPDYENADTFVERLVRDQVLVSDPVVTAALNDQLPEMSERTLRYRFWRATGLTQSKVRQFERAQHAATLLQQGKSILDTVDEAGYFDQPHLTRSLKQWVGHTPAQLTRIITA